MPVLWSSELMKWEYRDLGATAMSVDWSGNNVLLAGRKWLAIKQINLEEDALDSVKKFPRYSKYEAASAEWCQTQQGQRLCALVSNQRVDVYHWRNGDLTCLNSLRGHTRVVSDTHFHRQDHNLLATCSIDTFTHIWDLRETKKPVLSLRAVAGVSQVQWNKVTLHTLATAHDGDIKIWDTRKVNSPINYISAHLSKVHGVDWSPHHEYQLVTSSHDGSIKYFDVNNPRRPENMITTNFPVWRAIYTPFGSGLLTIGVGYGGVPRGEQAGVVGVWVGGTLTHRLVGHTDTVQTMVWRNNTSPDSYQLVTWARDQTLRVWCMHPDLLKKCHHYLPDESDEDEGCSDSASISSNTESRENLNTESRGQEIQMVKLSSQKSSSSLDEEFESVRDMANTVVTDMSLDHRTCTVRTEKNGFVANMQISFPPSTTAFIAIPKFSWLSGTNIDGPNTIKILQAINKTAHQRLKNNQPCLLQCLKILATFVDQIPPKSKEDADPSKSNRKCQSDNESAGDACIPFPRTCGAKWGGVSTLVVFNRPPHARRLSLKQDSGTPRSMASLSVVGSLSPLGAAGSPSPTSASNFSQYMHRHVSNSITTFYFQDRWRNRRNVNALSRNRGSISSINSPRVVLYGADHLFPINLNLAEKYIVNINDPIKMCTHNAEVAAEEGQTDLQKAWILAGLAAKALLEQQQAEDSSLEVMDMMMDSCEDTATWTVHPLCCNLVQSLISQYANCTDVQMAAMLACTFAVFNENNSSSALSTASGSSFGNGTSPYNTDRQYSEITNSDGWTITRNTRNSLTETPDSTLYSRTDGLISCAVDENYVHLYNCFKRAYADVLHRSRLLIVRTEVMKQVVVRNLEEEKHSGLELCVACASCGTSGVTVRCASCSAPALLCAVCGQGVRGLAAACPLCAHSGHVAHMLWWFSSNDLCPAGCGCRCAQHSWKALV